jgi:hypothetical protein
VTNPTMVSAPCATGRLCSVTSIPAAGWCVVLRLRMAFAQRVPTPRDENVLPIIPVCSVTYQPGCTHPQATRKPPNHRANGLPKHKPNLRVETDPSFATQSSQQRTFTRMRAASGLCPQADMELPLETLPNPTRAAKVIDTDSWLRVGGQA